MKKFLVMLLAVCMMLTAAFATGCKGKNKGAYDPDNFLTEEQALAEYGDQYRIVKNPVTIEIFVPRGSMNPRYETMEMFKVLSRRTNITFEFNHADTASYENLRSAAWFGGDLPDFFLFSNSMEEQVSYSEEGVLIPFNDPNLVVEGVQVGSLVDNYMPNYKALLDNNFNIDTKTKARDVVTLPDGKMYSTVSANDVPRDLTYKMWINQKWIDNINTTPGLKTKLSQEFGVSELPSANDINTIDELLLVLRAFKKLDANKDGDPDNEIPATAAEMEYLRNFILAAYGAVSNNIEISNDGKSFNYTPATEPYREFLKMARTMFKEGLIDNNTYSILGNEQMAGNGAANRLGMFCAAAAYLVVGYDLDSDYTVFGPITSDYYNGTPLHYGFTNFSASACLIPVGTPYVREIARLMDIMYSDLGTQLIAYGEEGTHWSWDNEEKTSWTFNVPSTWEGTQEEYRATISPNVGTGASVYWKYDFIGKMNDDIVKRLNTESERYIPFLKAPIPEDIILSREGYDETSSILLNLMPYIEMVEGEFITGVRDPFNDKDWNDHLNELVNYRYQKVVDIYNAAL